MNSVSYEHLTVQLDPCQEMMTGAYRTDWNRPMCINTKQWKEFAKGDAITLCEPICNTTFEENMLQERVRKLGVNHVYTIPVDQAVVTFYRKQGKLTKDQGTCIVIEAQTNQIDYSLLQIRNGEMKRLAEYRQDECQLDLDMDICSKKTSSLPEDLFQIRQWEKRMIKSIQMGIRALEIRNPSMSMTNKTVVLLAGALFDNTQLMEALREHLETYQFLSYRPRQVAVLGAIYWSKDKGLATTMHCASENDDLQEKEFDLEKPFYYSQLSDSLKEAYKAIWNALVNKQLNVWIPAKDTNELLDVYVHLEKDNPEIEMIWDYMGSKLHYETRNLRKGMNLDLKYVTNGKAKMVRINEKVNQMLFKYTREKAYNDEELLQKVYDDIKAHCKYTDASLKDKNNNYPDRSYTIETIVNQDGVCAGYAYTLRYILGKLQLPILYIAGKSHGSNRGHAWNMYQNLEGHYMHLDVTWDLQRKGSHYYALDDYAMCARRHTWNRRLFPKCG